MCAHDKNITEVQRVENIIQNISRGEERFQKLNSDSENKTFIPILDNPLYIPGSDNRGQKLINVRKGNDSECGKFQGNIDFSKYFTNDHD